MDSELRHLLGTESHCGQFELRIDRQHVWSRITTSSPCKMGHAGNPQNECSVARARPFTNHPNMSSFQVGLLGAMDSALDF